MIEKFAVPLRRASERFFSILNHTSTLRSGVPHDCEVRSSPGVARRRTSQSGRQCSISLQGRSADPARAPILDLPWGSDLAPRATERWRDGSDPREWSGAGGRFRAHLCAASTSWRSQASLGRAFTRLASQAIRDLVRPTGIEPMSARWHRAALPLSYGRWCTEQDSNLRSRRHPIYSQASLPLEYLCEIDWRGRPRDRPHLCWRKADGSNAAPCGAHPFSRRGAGHSSGAFPVSC